MTSTPTRTVSPGPRVADEKVLILDFGSQYAQLIARRVRDRTSTARSSGIDHRRAGDRAGPAGASSSPAARPASTRTRPRSAIRIFSISAFRCWASATACNWPARCSAARSTSAPAREYGRAQVAITSHADLFAGLPDETEVWMSHGDQVARVSDDFLPLATHGHLPVRGGQAPQPAGLRLAVPSRGDAHAAGQDSAGQFPHRHLPLPRHLATGRFCRAVDRGNPPAGSAATG